MGKTITSDANLRREYHTWLRLERGYSPNTIEGYEMDLDKLRAYGEKHKVDIVHMSFDELQECIYTLFKDVRAEGTQAPQGHPRRQPVPLLRPEPVHPMPAVRGRVQQHGAKPHAANGAPRNAG